MKAKEFFHISLQSVGVRHMTTTTKAGRGRQVTCYRHIGKMVIETASPADFYKLTISSA